MQIWHWRECWLLNKIMSYKADILNINTVYFKYEDTEGNGS